MCILTIHPHACTQPSPAIASATAAVTAATKPAVAATASPAQPAASQPATAVAAAESAAAKVRAHGYGHVAAQHACNKHAISCASPSPSGRRRHPALPLLGHPSRLGRRRQRLPRLGRRCRRSPAC